MSGDTSARPPLSRTLAGARWREYGALLEHARARGYRLRSLEDWLADGGGGEPTMILRHDVDQDPRSALRMASIEEALGVRSTWYFRWRTAHPFVIARLRARGCAVGLHYETLTRHLLESGRREPEARDVEHCRALLQDEIRTFAALHGAILSVCPHGDSRVPGVANGILVDGVDLQALGVRWDARAAMRRHRLGFWLTDRSAPGGAWKDGQDPLALLDGGVSPILCLTHPNNWSSGLSLWTDRALRRAFGQGWRGWQRHPLLVHARSDAPPAAGV